MSDIAVGDVIYSKRSKRFATVTEVGKWGFNLLWNKKRYDSESLLNRYKWIDWCGQIPDEYLIFDTDNEKLTAMLKYET